MYIYAIQCASRKYYIGKTNNLNKRLYQHKNGFGSEWTKKDKFVKLIETINSSSHFDEDKYTKIYMDKLNIIKIITSIVLNIIKIVDVLLHIAKV